MPTLQCQKSADTGVGIFFLLCFGFLEGETQLFPGNNQNERFRKYLASVVLLDDILQESGALRKRDLSTKAELVVLKCLLKWDLKQNSIAMERTV